MISPIHRKSIFTKLHFLCSDSKPHEGVFRNGKAYFSFSQFSKAAAPSINNFYFQESFTKESLSHNNSVFAQSKDGEDRIFRCILTPELASDEMHLDINAMRQSQMLNNLVELSLENKETFSNNPAMVIINGQIPIEEQEHNENAEEPDQIGKNLTELHKLFEDGFGLKLAFMISQYNTEKFEGNNHNNRFLKSIKNKPKAINSNVVLKGIRFEDIVYNQGFKLQHIFLRSYSKNGRELDALSANQAYDLKEIMYILNSIEFCGKVIIPNNDHFEQNCQFVEQVAISMGFNKHSKSDFDDDNWYMML